MISIAKVRGMTLIELMIVVVIVGILAGVGYPSYVEFVKRSNRSEAQRELVRIANLQEQYFVDHRSYATDLSKLNLGGTTFTTESGHYEIASSATASTFTLTATALSDLQKTDTDCKSFTITHTGKKDATSSNCWEN